MKGMSNNCTDMENTTLIYNLIDKLILEMIEQPIKKHATTKVKQTCGDDSTGTYGYVCSHKTYVVENGNDIQ